MPVRLTSFIIASLMIFISACSLSKPAPKPESAVIVSQGVTVDGNKAGGLTREQVLSLLNDIAARNDVLIRDARFDDTTGQIIPSISGRRLDIPSTLDRVMSARANEKVASNYKEELPLITTEKLKKAKRIGEFKTPLLNSPAERTENIRLTARLMNNGIIPPGYAFSFNYRAGDVTLERGFKFAIIYGDNGKEEQGLGGGMCQVSTTLYNAALAAGFPILERHPHSKPVDYVPAGLDATTFTDKDLRFLNHTASNVVIRSHVNEAYVYVDIWSLQD